MSATEDETRRQVYSYGTIQSDPKGRFGELVRHIEQQPDYQEHLRRVAEFASDQERLDYVDARFLAGCIRLVPLFKRKDSREAERSRLEGNELFRQKQFQAALHRYNRSVLRANPGDSEIALAVANRSACSFHLEAYGDAITDIQFAFSLGYPTEKRTKLYVRLAKSYIATGQAQKATASLRVAKSLIAAAEGGEEAQKTLIEIDHLEEESASNNVKSLLAKSVAEAASEEEDHVARAHPVLAGFSSSLDVDYAAGKGRFVVAAKDIDAGEVVVEEAAFASVLYPERNGQNCQCCLRRLQIVVPCHVCSGVAFCSFACREEAASFHGFECRYNDVLTGFGCSQVARLALRIITQRPFEQFLSLRGKLGGGSKRETSSSAAQEDPYITVFNLADNNDQRWSEDVFRRTLMAGLLLKVLKESRYLEAAGGGSSSNSSSSNSSRSEELFLGSLLLRNLQVLQFNAHEVYETLRGSRTSLRPCKSQTVALAVYPHASYFNHSCHGAVARCFDGSKMVMRALRGTRRGEELHDNYGPTFYFKGLQERRRELMARYWFHCLCPPCRGDWPLLARLPKSGLAHPCSAKAQAAMDGGRAREAAGHLLELLSDRCRADSLPTEEVVRAEDKLRTCISNMGNVVFTELAGKAK